VLIGQGARDELAESAPWTVGAAGRAEPANVAQREAGSSDASRCAEPSRTVVVVKTAATLNLCLTRLSIPGAIALGECSPGLRTGAPPDYSGFLCLFRPFLGIH